MSRAQDRIDEVALALIGGEPIDSAEMDRARLLAVDTLKAFAELDRLAGREPVDCDPVVTK